MSNNDRHPGLSSMPLHVPLSSDAAEELEGLEQRDVKSDLGPVGLSCISEDRTTDVNIDVHPDLGEKSTGEVAVGDNVDMDEEDAEVDELDHEDEPNPSSLVNEKSEALTDNFHQTVSPDVYETSGLEIVLDLPASSPPVICNEYPSSSPPCYTAGQEDPEESTLVTPIRNETISSIWEGLSSSPPQLPPYTSSPPVQEEEDISNYELQPRENESVKEIEKPSSNDVLLQSNTGTVANEHAAAELGEGRGDTEERPQMQAAPTEKDYICNVFLLENTADAFDQNSMPIPPPIEQHHPSDTRYEASLQPSLPIIEKDKAGDHSSNKGILTKKRSIENSDNNESPAPKRMTLESQRRQHQKLSTPFRSPLLQKPDLTNSRLSLIASPGADALPTTPTDKETPRTPISTRTDKLFETSKGPSSAKVAPSKCKSFLQSTSKATSQFKSPLTSSTKTPQSSTFRSGASPTIQSLEAQLQTLKRAIQLKKTDEAEKLEALIKQWRDAGRDVAWDLWAVVREQSGEDSGNYNSNYPGTNTKSTNDWQGFQSGWGWADGLSNSNRSWGWDNVGETNGAEEDDEEVNSQEFISPSKLEAMLYKALSQKSGVRRQSILPPTPRGAYYEQQLFVAHDDDTLASSKIDLGDGVSADEEGSPKASTSHANTLGGMLTRLGIAHNTLGWSEDEGDFVNV